MQLAFVGQVSSEDIAFGLPGNATECPVANCLTRSFPDVCEVSVNMSRVVVLQKDGSRFVAKTPWKVKLFLYLYDVRGVEFWKMRFRLKFVGTLHRPTSRLQPQSEPTLN